MDRTARGHLSRVLEDLADFLDTVPEDVEDTGLLLRCDAVEQDALDLIECVQKLQVAAAGAGV